MPPVAYPAPLLSTTIIFLIDTSDCLFYTYLQGNNSKGRVARRNEGKGESSWKVLVQKSSDWRRRSWMGVKSHRKKRRNSFARRMRIPCCCWRWPIRFVRSSMGMRWISVRSSMQEAGIARRIASSARSRAGITRGQRCTAFCRRKRSLRQRRRRRKQGLSVSLW